MRGSRNFRQGVGGGGGGPGQSDKKGLTFFLVLSLFYYFTKVKWLISNKKLSFFKVPEGVQHFPGGGGGGVQHYPGGSHFFQGGGGGSNCLFPLETHITCDFPGGGSGPSVPPSGSALEVRGRGIETSHRQDSSPTCILKVVHRQTQRCV